MKDVIFFRSNPGKWIYILFACLKMLNFTKPVNCLVIKTAKKINTKLVHPFQKFGQSLLAKFYCIKDFKFLTHELKQGKTFV